MLKRMIFSFIDIQIEMFLNNIFDIFSMMTYILFFLKR